MIDITKDIRSLTDFKRDTSRFVTELKESGRPSILTVNGKPELVVMDAKSWQEMQDRLEYAQTVSSIRTGLREADQGRGMEASAFFADLKNDKA